MAARSARFAFRRDLTSSNFETETRHADHRLHMCLSFALNRVVGAVRYAFARHDHCRAGLSRRACASFDSLPALSLSLRRHIFLSSQLAKATGTRLISRLNSASAFCLSSGLRLNLIRIDTGPATVNVLLILPSTFCLKNSDPCPFQKPLIVPFCLIIFFWTLLKTNSNLPPSCLNTSKFTLSLSS